jgi:Family of unknown function (DUF5522)
MTIDKQPKANEEDGTNEIGNSAAPAELIEGVDYYVEGGLFVFTEHFLQKRSYCCENDCRHCPYRDKNFNRA